MEITPELARYVINYYSDLLTPEERAARRHDMSVQKFGDKLDSRRQIYLRNGLITDKPELLALLEQGFDQFAIHCARRILTECPDKVFINLCPKCNKLARTPYAKQCRFCGWDWH